MKRLVALALASAMTATFAQQPAVAKPAVAKPAPSIPEQVKAIEESINNIAIPAWVDAQAQETFARFNAWKGDDVTVVFPVITDVHTSRRDSFKHVAYLNHVAKRFNFDFIADLGDLGVDTPPTANPDIAMAFVKRHATLHHQYPGVSVLAVGNHEHNRKAPRDKWIKDSELGELFNVPNLKKSKNIVLAADTTYGYYDIPTAKLRVFFLNTSDHDDCPGYYTMSEKQLQFLADNLKFKEPGWTALTLTHYCVLDIGNWVGSSSSLRNGNIYLKMLEDFIKGKADKRNNVSWDFTQNKDCRFAINVTGDSHFDAQQTINGINIAITQGYGGISKKHRPPHAIVTPLNQRKSMLVDIVAVKPAKRQIMFFRLGAGGKERDRAFTW